MPSSMTGYGQADAGGYHVEIKGVNHRFKEIRIKLPRDLSQVEMHVRNAVQGAIQRGKVDVIVTRGALEAEKGGLSLNWELAQACYDDLVRMAERFGGEVSFRDVLLIPGVMSELDGETEERWALIREPLETAIQVFLDSRLEEGMRLRHDILQRVEALRGMCASVKLQAEGMPEAYRDRLKANLDSLLADKAGIDEMRLAQEVAMMAEKCDITEELVRLQSHLEALSEVMHTDGAIGRRLDFMLQEINREWNTIGSKSQDVAISHLVIDAKTELEKIREQAQNIE